MNFVLQKIVAVFNISRHLLTCRKVVTNPLRCARLFMERTPDSYSTELRFGALRFTARKEDMLAVREVLVDGGYDFMVPFLKGLRGTPVILDCGANIGSFAIRVLKERPDARVLSIEAAPDTYGLLLANQKRNPDMNWGCIHAALWNTDDGLTLQRSAVSVMHTVGDEGPASESIPSCRPQTVRATHRLEHIHLIKMDIEGAETTVIPSAVDTIDSDMMIIELHKNISDPREVCRILSDRYPFAYVSPSQPGDSSSPNVVYCLSKSELVAQGLTRVDLMDHLFTRYAPELK